jgi:hypothetical protein
MFIKSVTVGVGFKQNVYPIGSPPQSGTMMWDSGTQAVRIANAENITHAIYPGNIHIEFDDSVQTALAWIREKRQEEEELRRLCATNEAIKLTVDHLKVLMALVKENK